MQRILTARGVGCVLIGLLLSGCSTYSYNGETYHSPDDAVAAQRQFEEKTLANIAILARTNPGTAIVIIPSKSTIEATGVTRKGSPEKKYVDFVANELNSDYEYFPKYLQASKAFSVVEARVVDHTTQEARRVAAGYAATVYLQMLSPDQVGWYLLTPNSSAPIEVHFDGTAQPGAPKVDSWVRSIVDGIGGGTKP